MEHTGSRHGAARAYYVLVGAALLLPVLVFAVGGWAAWRSTEREANAQLTHALAASAEHASRVLDTNLLIAARINDLLGGLDAAAIAAGAAQLRAGVAAITRQVPHVTGVVVTDAAGKVLLSMAAEPFTGDATARLFHGLPEAGGSYLVDRLVTDPLAGSSAIVLAYRRGDAAGAILVITSAAAFAAAEHLLLAGSSGYAAGLMLQNGTQLARFPLPPVTGGTDDAKAILQRALSLQRPGTLAPVTVSADGEAWLVASQKLAHLPVYVAVARRTSAVAAEWRSLMATHLIFGIPATIALLVLSLIAARRAGRESATVTALQAEIRRRETAEDALRQAQKMEAVGRLTAGIAHDFNNHLTVISSNIELLKRRMPKEAQAQAPLADAAMQGVQRAATLTHRLLAFSRQQPLDPEPLDMARLLSGIMDLLHATLGETVVLKLSAANGLWQTRVDANQMESAVLHLAVNARDAMPQGGELSVAIGNVSLDDAAAALHPDATPGDFVRIAISDTGVGMTPEVAAKAFEPFFTTKPLGKGTGLGLSMVYGFVRQSGGHVTVDSQRGRGTTISLHLPRYVRQEEMARQPDLAPAAAVAGAGGETVLVVEDDDAVRCSAVQALREMGYQVLEAPDAMEAIRLIADRGGIDLLFTDVGLPGGVDGRALADAARTASPTIRILFTTGYARHAVQEACSGSQGVHFLAKPFTLEQLGVTVREVLDASIAAGVPAESEAG